MTHRYMSSGVIPAAHISGAPGPPMLPSEHALFLRDDDDEDEMLIGHEPDDLGDLMQEMREGAAWAESLAMESDLALCPPPAAPAAPSPPSVPAAAQQLSSGLMPPSTAAAADQDAVDVDVEAAPQSTSADGCILDGADCGAVANPQGRGAGMSSASVDALAALTQRAQRESIAQQEAAVAELQPALRALLMHPGAAGGRHMMIPVGGGAPTTQPAQQACDSEATQQAQQAQAVQYGGISCAASLAACARPGSAQPVWPPPPPRAVAQAGAFYGAPAMRPRSGQPSPFYAMPMAAPMGMQQGAPSPFHFYQAVPGGFAPAPTTGPQEMKQEPQDASRPAAGAPASGAPPMMRTSMFSPGAGAFPPLPMPQPNSSGGSANASDGTTVRLRGLERSSFDSDSGSGMGPAGGTSGQQQQQHPHGSAAPQMCSAAALAAFDQAAFDQPCAAGFDWRTSAGFAAAKCDAPSDSSDCEDHGEREHLGYEHSTQVVPEVVVPDVLAVAPEMLCFACPPPPPPPQLLPMPPPPVGAMPLSAFAPAADFPPLPTFGGYYDTPAAHTARLARHASLERYRLKKARRGFGKKIRYVARKVNADKRPRVKGRFVKAEEAADMLAAAAAAAAASPGESDPDSSASPMADLEQSCCDAMSVAVA